MSRYFVPALAAAVVVGFLILGWHGVSARLLLADGAPDQPIATAVPTDQPAATAAPTDQLAATAVPTDQPAAAATPTDPPAAAATSTDQAPVNSQGYWDALARQIDTEILPIPKEPQTPLSTLRAQGHAGWSSFRTPLPSVPVWNPAGQKRVGLQAGHWEYADAPDELAELRSNPGTSGGGEAEWQVTLDIANRAAEMLRADGILVDVLPTTIPVRYRANAFVAIHADGDNAGALNGFKVARPGFSSIPTVDDELVSAIDGKYAADTGLPERDNQISLRMTYYYAFNSRRYQYAVAPGVPQAIIETGFLTNWSDRNLLLGSPDVVARGIADGVLKFLQEEDQG